MSDTGHNNCTDRGRGVGGGRVNRVGQICQRSAISRRCRRDNNGGKRVETADVKEVVEDATRLVEPVVAV